MNLKGISPILSGVILVTLVVIIGAVLFSMISNFLYQEKKDEGNFKILCEEVLFDAKLNNQKYIQLVNEGNIDIADFELAFNEPGSSSTEILSKIDNSFNGLISQQAGSFDISSKLLLSTNINKIQIYPIIKVSIDNRKTLHTCKNSLAELDV